MAWFSKARGRPHYLALTAAAMVVRHTWERGMMRTLQWVVGGCGLLARSSLLLLHPHSDFHHTTQTCSYISADEEHCFPDKLYCKCRRICLRSPAQSKRPSSISSENAHLFLQLPTSESSLWVLRSVLTTMPDLSYSSLRMSLLYLR